VIQPRRFLAAAAAAVLVPLTAPADAGAAVVCDIAGKVTTASGTAVPGAKLDFWNDSGQSSGTTKADGSYAFSTVCGSGTLHLWWQTPPLAGLPEGADFWGTVTATDGGRYDLQLPPVVKVTLNVRDDTGVGFGGALVYQTNEHTDYETNQAPLLDGHAGFTSVVEVPGKFTDSSGKATLVTFPDRDMDLTVRPPASSPLQPRTLLVDATASVTKTVDLSRTSAGVPFAGVVRDSAGRGIPGLYMHVTGAQRGYDTDASGAFSAYGPSVTAQLGGGISSGGGGEADPVTADSPASFSFSGIPVTGGAGRSVEITMPPVSHVRLTVLNHDGWPQSYVHLEEKDNYPYRKSDPAVLVPGTPARPIDMRIPRNRTDGDGKMSFNIYPMTTVSGLRLQWYASTGDEMFLDIPAFDGRVDQDFTLTLPPPPTKYTVSGTVTDADGKPVTGARVGTYTSNSWVDAQGRFSLPVNEGERSIVWVDRSTTNTGGAAWTVNPTLPDNFSVHVPLKVDGPTDVALKLPRAKRITVRATDPVDNSPAEGAGIGEVDGYAMEFPALAVQGAAAPAMTWQSVSAPPTDAAGVTVFRSWPMAKAPTLVLSGRHNRVGLTSRIVGLELTSDKTLDLLLGTTQSPTTYQPPGSVSGVTAARTNSSGTGSVQTATAGSTAATQTMDAAVRWTAPSRTGGLKISGYRVTASPGGRTVTVGPTARVAVIRGLARGTTYSFTVQAVNRIGKAAGTSAKLDVTAPRVTMGAPVKSGGTAKFTWKGIDDASGIAGYDVRFRKARTGESLGSFIRLATGTKATSRTLDLSRGYTYCVSVRAQDRVGRVGSWSAPRCVSRPAR
jgi:protocatechuate 3,4-dioxygenase beta subunit